MKKSIKKKKRACKSTKRIMFFGVISICTCLIILVSILKTVSLIINKYNEARELEESLASLMNSEEELNNEIVKLQDPEYLARYAREKYFYSKDNELIIRLPNE